MVSVEAAFSDIACQTWTADRGGSIPRFEALVEILPYTAEGFYIFDAPLYPMSLIEGRPAGSAVIECIIDRRGRVCLPRIISASEQAFGWSAATAMVRFVPPKAKGKPVDVKVRIPFNFAAPNL